MSEQLSGDNMEKGRWGLSIDIEGFSKKYEHSERMKDTAIMALNELMSAVIKIGENVYPGQPDNNYSERLFAHQFGDGFVITSDYYERNAERCVAIAISLMRHMMMRGYATKVAISTGGMSDISGCYPEAVRDSQCNRVHIGRGLMTTVSVMGTALTRSHKLLSRISGSVLVLDASRFEKIPRKFVASQKDGYFTIDWLSNELTLAQEISTAANLEYGDRAQLLKRFDRYITQEPVPPPHWVGSTRASWKC
jgi:hypothetical protein